ncbi:MAG: hypothetical protein ACTSXA_12110 [Candidatus Heimdallarchaeota archaeon]
MKKFVKVLSIVLCLIGVSSIAVVQAAQPYKHVTFGAVNALLEAGFTGGFLVRDLDNYCPVFDYGDEGRISIWFPGEYCVDDAHLMMIGYFFNFEDHKLAEELWKFEKEGNVKTRILLDGLDLDLKMTPVKQWLGEIPPNSTYHWLYTVGVVFRAGEIPIGFHTTAIKQDLWIDGFGYLTMFEWYSFFNILECWH